MAPTLNITKPESSQEIGALVAGDVVQLRFDYQPTWKYGSRESTGVYVGNNFLGQCEFIIPDNGPTDFILMYRVSPRRAKVEKGTIVLDEDLTTTQAVTPSKPDYRRLDDMLISAGLRKIL